MTPQPPEDHDGRVPALPGRTVPRPGDVPYNLPSPQPAVLPGRDEATWDERRELLERVLSGLHAL